MHFNGHTFYSVSIWGDWYLHFKNNVTPSQALCSEHREHPLMGRGGWVLQTLRVCLPLRSVILSGACVPGRFPFLQMLVSVLIVLYLLTNVYLKKGTWADGMKFRGRKACKIKPLPQSAPQPMRVGPDCLPTAVRADACACTSCPLFVSLLLTFSNGHVREPRGRGAKLVIHRGPFPPSKVPT